MYPSKGSIIFLDGLWNIIIVGPIKHLFPDLVPNDLAAIPGKIDTAIANTNGNDPYDMASCKTAVEAIITTNDKAGGVTDTVVSDVATEYPGCFKILLSNVKPAHVSCHLHSTLAIKMF